MPRDATLPTTIEIRTRRLPKASQCRRRSKDRSPPPSIHTPRLFFHHEHLLQMRCSRSAAVPRHRTSSFHLDYASQTGKLIYSAWQDCGGNCCPISPRHAPPKRARMRVYVYEERIDRWWSPPNFPDPLIAIKRTYVEITIVSYDLLGL